MDLLLECCNPKAHSPVYGARANVDHGLAHHLDTKSARGDVCVHWLAGQHG